MWIPIANALLFVIILVPLLVFSIPLLAIWTHHRRKMEEMRAQRNAQYNEEIRAEFASVRAEIKSLRDTSMQYDLSFDTNLQHLERRLAQLERQGRAPLYATEEPTQSSQYMGR